MSNYYNPVRIIKTEDWQSKLENCIDSLNISEPILITSKGNRKRLKLDSKFKRDCIFSDVSSNPTFEDCVDVLKFCQEKKFDGVIALGGGSVMDLAKVVIAHLSLEMIDINKLIEFKGPYTKETPSIFLPTTHGTASEVTMWGTLWNMEEKKKYSISHPSLYPSVAILDGSLTLSLPLDISIITTMDALSHSFESIWNKNANLKSTSYAIEAINIIINNAIKLKENPSNLRLRKLFLYASNLAGCAFSNTKTAAAHSISYPLTLHYGIPHGIASSITLLPLLQINKVSIDNELKQICDYNKITFDELKLKIELIPHSIVSIKLRDWGVEKSSISNLVEESFTKGRMDNNIVDLSKSDVRNILNQVY
jgi:alcohol dehydrogenase class IV